nr:DUF1684 domain-containing protein [Luteimonas huabeiensis]
MAAAGGLAGSLAIALAWLALAGCAADAPPAADPAATEADAAYAREEAAWRAARERSLLADDGWTTLVGLHWLSLPAHHLGNGERIGIDLRFGPPRLGLVQQAGDTVYFTPEHGVAVALDGEPVRGRVALRSDRDAAPTRLAFDQGKGELTLIERGGRRALRVRHADAPARVRFAGLRFWEPDRGWRVPARFVPHPPGRTLEIVNILGQTEAMPNPGAVEFERDGRTWRLEAIGDGDGLFLMFADGTSGHGSYGAGRYLDAAAPDADGRVTLDFNRAYNPPCAYTLHATCPLPPSANRLRLPIAAGEQAYAGSAL